MVGNEEARLHSFVRAVKADNISELESRVALKLTISHLQGLYALKHSTTAPYSTIQKRLRGQDFCPSLLFIQTQTGCGRVRRRSRPA